MNKRLKGLAFFACIITGLTGCVSQDFIDSKADAESVQARMDALRPTGTLNNVNSISRPPVNANPIETKARIGWLEDTVQLNDVKGLPLSVVLNDMMDGVDAQVWYAEDVSSNIPITLHSTTTRQNILNLLTNQTGYGFIVTQDKLAVRRYLSETFVLNLPTGKYSGQLGSQGQSSGDEGDTSVQGQYINVTYSDLDMFTEVSTAIETLLKSDDDDEKLIGGVEPIPSLSSITVRTTPARMAQVKQLIHRYQSELSKQVLLDIRVLEFRSDLAKDRGIDWSLVKDIGEGTLQFVIPGTTTTATGSGYGLAFQGAGKWDGTTAFIKALEQQGTVSTETPISFLSLSSQPARISQTLKTPYLSDISVDVTDTTTSTSTTRGEVTEGVDMMVSTNVQKNFVWLRIAGKLTKIAGDTTQVVNDATLRFIQERSVDLNFTNKLRYGQTVVIGSIKQQTTGANKSASFGIDALGSQSTSHETVETLVLLTPRRVQ